jgi:hypothetical protein
MNLKDIETVQRLQEQLNKAQRVVGLFKAHPSPTAAACVMCGEEGNIVSVDLPPVRITDAIAAAERARDKIVEQLLGLGVTVDGHARTAEPAPSPAPTPAPTSTPAPSPSPSPSPAPAPTLAPTAAPTTRG